MELLDDGVIQTTVREVANLLVILYKGLPSVGDIKRAGLPKKFLKWEYQLLFEFINKALVPRSEKRIIASAADLFLMEQLDELEAINLPGIKLEHMHKVMTWKNANHGIPYGYLLNHVFEHFRVPLGRGVPGTVKQMFSSATLLKCECTEGKVKGKSHVSDLFEQQESLKRELNDLTVTLSAKEVEIARLKAPMQQTISRGPDTSVERKEEVEKLRAENAQLLETNASLGEEV
ncbi:hypothetical protein KY290_017900 [Solanum tuberosum]|uniref:Uncharacterized protein n=1 Tax=Solanum tuberosum TaxID=4113 RepID=A0ABQ7VEP6_SOLTU|nr:hypothetical protein KY285_016863 [Solanum tuberosum]KAH0761827.1 hypothetical protein KY290_017900 [Solanum tuberosum]